MSGLELAALSEICSLVTDGTHDSPKLRDEGVPFIKGKHINSGRVDFDSCDFISPDDHEKCIKRVKPQRDDILMANIGASIGDCARVLDDREFSIKNVALLRPDSGKVDPSYFYQLVKSQIFQSRLMNLRLGAAQPYVSLEALRRFELPIVKELESQRKIGAVCDTYDDLIENNRRRIGLLEQAARLLYREWFVHLRFPGHETAKIVDGLPEGWERVTLSDHVELVKDAVQPGAFRPDDVHIGLEHIPRRSFVLSEWEPTEGLESHKFRFEAGDIIFGKIRPYFHKVGFALRDGVASSDAFVWRVKDQKAWSLLICATSSDHFVAVASKTVKEGSKMPRADWKVLAKYKIPKPNDDLLAEFDGRVRSIAEECRKLALQNRALTRARDLLLPRLMDGRIPV